MTKPPQAVDRTLGVRELKSAGAPEHVEINAAMISAGRDALLDAFPQDVLFGANCRLNPGSLRHFSSNAGTVGAILLRKVTVRGEVNLAGATRAACIHHDA